MLFAERLAAANGILLENPTASNQRFVMETHGQVRDACFDSFRCNMSVLLAA